MINMKKWFFVCTNFWKLLQTSKKYSWHQRITLTVEDQTSCVSASTVMKATVYDEAHHMNPTHQRWREHVIGEMPFVALSDGRSVFALMCNEYFLLTRFLLSGSEYEESDIRQIVADRSRTRTIRADEPDAPFLITFTDLSNPRSIARFQTSRAWIVIERTSDEVTAIGSIDRALPWLRDLPLIRTALSPTAFVISDRDSTLCVPMRHDFVREDI